MRGAQYLINLTSIEKFLNISHTLLTQNGIILTIYNKPITRLCQSDSNKKPLFILGQTTRSHLINYPILNLIYFFPEYCQRWAYANFILMFHWIQFKFNFFNWVNLSDPQIQIYIQLRQLIDKQNMIQYICGFLVIVLAYLVNTLYIQPTKLKNYYSRLLRQKGYKVYEYPFKMFGVPFFEEMQVDQVKHKIKKYKLMTQLVGYDVILHNLMNKINLIFLSPNLIKQFHTVQKVYSLPKKTVTLQLLKRQMPNSIVFVQGKLWKNRRAVLSKIFNFDYIVSMIPTISKFTDMAFEKYEKQHWKRHPQDQKVNEFQVQLSKMNINIFSSIVLSCFIGMEYCKETINGLSLSEATVYMNELASILSFQPLVVLFGDLFVKLRIKKSYAEYMDMKILVKESIGKFVRKCSEQYKANSASSSFKPKNIIELILSEIQKENSPSLYDIQSLIDEVLMFIIAGSDTTSNFSTAMMFYVFENKAVESRLRKEIDAVIKTDEDITYQNLKKIEYIDLIQYETHRMFGTLDAVVTRGAVKDDVMIADIPIKKEISVFYFLKSLSYDPAYYQDPHTFKPERFENLQSNELINLVSMQFSGGPRGCIGKQLAHLESKIALVKFMRRYSSLTQLQERVLTFKLVNEFQKTNIRLTKKN